MKILSKNASWNFKNQVPKRFSHHIKKSIPFYKDMHNMVCELSDFFLKEKSVCYDLGSSTGLLLNKIGDRHSNKKINLIGIESIKEMIVQAKKENKNRNKIKYINKDVRNLKFKKSDLITSCYTIQFIDAKYRQDVIKRIYKSLNWGGAFIIFEKIRASDARFQDIFNQVYLEFKLKNKFSELEIVNKSKSLKGVLEPFSEYGNLGLLKRAGFVDIIPIFQWFCFKGFLCIK
tara:strand:- start:1612 stop:2307 length:696 start_codon:yes stop_codon:yes gene_type:complete